MFDIDETVLRTLSSEPITWEAYEKGQGRIIASATGKRTAHLKHSNVYSTDNPVWTNRAARREALRIGYRVGGPFSSRKVEVHGIGSPRLMRTKSFYGDTYPWGFEKFDILFPSTLFTQAIGLKSQSLSSRDHYDRINSSTPAPLSVNALAAAGTTAISRCVPTNPLVDLSTSIAETVSARKFFSLPGKSGSLSGEYLNFQLGIAPVVSDIKDVYETAQITDKVLKQYERDAGRLVRRRYEFPDETNTVTTVTKGQYPAFLGSGANAYLTGTGTLTTTTTTSRKTWFVGAFTYYLPKAGWRKDLAHYNRLYGVTPGNETAWNVIPYSFVADYFANMGDVQHNLDRFRSDGLVMPYGYIMSTTVEQIDQNLPCQVADEAGGFRLTNVTGSLTRSTKQRDVATPYGFGVSYGSLTPRQISIMAALGINRR